MNTEGGRMANLMAKTRCNMAAVALAKAQALSQKGCCKPASDNTLTQPVALPSVALNAAAACYTYQSVTSGVPESVRIARTQQETLDSSVDPANPSARFSQFRRPFIQVCPPIPIWYYRAGEPVSQGKSCPLPNKPYNLIIPG